MCGEYVRTISQGIKRVDDININAPINKYKYKTGESDWDGEWYGTIKTTAILKHSPNIIDLIEVGDYVNGSKVVDVMEDIKTGELHLEMTYNYTNEEKGDCTIYNKDIKTIVTKEMMKSIEYRIN